MSIWERIATETTCAFCEGPRDEAAIEDDLGMFEDPETFSGCCTACHDESQREIQAAMDYWNHGRRA